MFYFVIGFVCAMGLLVTAGRMAKAMRLYGRNVRAAQAA